MRKKRSKKRGKILRRRMGKHPIAKKKKIIVKRRVVKPKKRGRKRETLKQKLIKKQKEILLIRSQERNRHRLNRVLEGFRPTRGMRNSLVFVDLDGKPSKSRSIKGYFFYVDKSGKRTLIKDFKEPKLLPPPRRLPSWNLTDFDKKKVVEKYYRKKIAHGIRKYGHITETQEERRSGKGIDFERFANYLAPILKAETEKDMSQRSYMLKFAVTVENGGVFKIPFIEVQFNLSDSQRLPIEIYKKFVFLKIYAMFAEVLFREYDQVTVGSSDFIKKLKKNRGKKRSQWMEQNRDELWEKNEAEEVVIRRIDWRIFKIR